MAKKLFKTAFILGAGLGTRLRPLTENRPKPLLPVGGRPIITYAMDHLIEAGVERFIVNTHHCPEAYSLAFPDSRWRGVPIHLRHEPVLLDTAGGLKNIEDLIGDDEVFFCYNGDIITSIPLQCLITAYRERRAGVTLALRSSGPLLNVEINREGEVCDMRNTFNTKGIRSCLFTGISIVESSFLSFLEKGKIESIVDVFLRRIVAEPGSIRGEVIDEGYWYDIGSMAVYENLKNLCLHYEGRNDTREFHN